MAREPLMVTNQLIPFLHLWVLVIYLLSIGMYYNSTIMEPTFVSIITLDLGFQG